MVKIALLVVVLAGFVFGQTQSPSQPAQSQTAQAVQAQVPPFTIKPIGKGVYAAISGRAGGNTGFIIGDNSVLVVDTFISQTPARDLLSEIRKITNLPVKYVVNTHYHLDHVAGNAIFSEAGATVIAHRNERAWVRTENLKFFQQNGATPTAEQRAQVASLVEPQIVYDHLLEVNLGNRPVRVVYFPGHTGGDSVVYIPDANVIFTGDLGWNQRIPNLIDATTSSWIETLDKIVARHPNAMFIPGHGDVATAQDMKAFRDYLATLRADVQRAQAAGQTGDALKQTILADLKPKYGTWPGFERLGPLNVEQTAAELAGTKKVPQAEADAGSQSGIAPAQSQERKTPMTQQGRILGIGGIFFKSPNQKEMKEWYGKHLGFADSGHGVMLPWREKDNPESEQMTVWTIFPGTTKYFEPSQASFMLNYIVDDLDALLARLAKEGVRIDPKRQDESYGRFAWIYDPDGNKIELWQPVK